MNNKKLGVVFLIISIILSVLLISLISGLREEAEALGCYNNENCIKLESKITITHFVFGIIGFILALGFYLIFFSKGEEALLKKIEQQDQKKYLGDKFDLILRGLDNYEKEVMNILKEEEGITQNTLLIRTNMSKAKLSYVLRDLENRDLIKRVSKGKTLAVFLKIPKG